MSKDHSAPIADRSPRWSAVVLITSFLVLVNCGSAQVRATDPLDLDPAAGPCTIHTGVAALNRLLWAFNHKAGDDAASLFAPDVVKVIQPMLEVTEFGWKAETVSEVQSIAESKTKTWFRLLGEPAASVSPLASDQNSASMGAVLVDRNAHFWSVV